MNQHVETTKEYIKKYKIEFIIGLVVVILAIAAIITVTIIARSSVPKIVYQPANACDLLTIAKAKELLGDNTVASGAKDPLVSGNTATSRCGYTDGNPDTQNMIVAAITVRSGIDDKGVQQNKTEFTNGKPTQAVEDVSDLGDGAYFNQQNGQLNVLNGRDWIIFSYGPGSAPESNTVEQAVQLAQKVVE